MIQVGSYVRIKDEMRFQMWYTTNVYVVVYSTNTYYGRVLGLDDTFTHNFLEKPYKVDVAVCCGVLYHLHSPIYLLELIVNKTDPEYIILESVVIKKDNRVYEYTEVETEVDNIPGNRYTSSGWKSAGVNIKLSQELLDLVMNNLGYCIVKRDDNLARFKSESKKFAIMNLYKKKDD